MLKKSIFITGMAVTVLLATQAFAQLVVQVTPNQWQDWYWREKHQHEWRYWHKTHHQEWMEWKTHNRHDWDRWCYYHRDDC